MIKQIQTQGQEKEQTVLNLCSKCLFYEINNWINEKWQYINDEARMEIMQELKTIKLRQGECIVCKNATISDGTSEKILRILKEKKTHEEITKEFKKFFCINF